MTICTSIPLGNTNAGKLWLCAIKKKKKNTASLYNELWQVNGHMAARGAENKGQLGAQS